MRIRRLAASGCAIAALSFVVAACGEDEEGGGGEGGATELTIYSSLPLQGTSRGQSLAVINGEKLALEEVGSKIGNVKLKYVSLDDSTAQNPGTADEGQTAQNARAAVRDQSTIVYLGEFNSGGTKVSLPILNKAGIPQISPSNTYGGLTTDEPGAEPGEPDKYYPTGKRTYARIVPARQDPGRRARLHDAGGRLPDRHAVGRQDHLRRRSRPQHRAGRAGRGPDDREPPGHGPQLAELPLDRVADQQRLLRVRRRHR